ncbi:MAG: hypothetical protein V1895_01590 [Parcubacteria group bacterium]
MSDTQQKKSHTALWVTIVVILAVLLLAVSGLFIWQWVISRDSVKSQLQVEQQVEQQLANLTDENKKLKEDLAESEARLKKESQKEEVPSLAIEDLPVVVYARGGLLSESEFAALQAEFAEKLVAPLSAYNLDQGHLLLTVNIEIPETEGQEFLYDAIYNDGVSEGALYGKRGESLDWWTPTCMDECEFTDEFRGKYPKVIDAYEGTL